MFTLFTVPNLELKSKRQHLAAISRHCFVLIFIHRKGKMVKMACDLKLIQN